MHAAYADLTVRLLFTDPQQSQEEYNFISISFPQVYDNVTSMIEYGPNCQALGNQMTIVGYNVTTLTFSVPVMENICWIVTISNISQSLEIQGNFSIKVMGLNSPGKVSYNYMHAHIQLSCAHLMLICLLSTDANRVSFDYSLSAVSVLFILFIIAYTPTVIWCTQRKYASLRKYQQKSRLSSGADHDD